MTKLCGRCKKEVFRFGRCDYCKRDVCFDCIKSSQSKSKTQNLTICKDCWSNMKTRKAYKNKRSVSVAQVS